MTQGMAGHSLDVPPFLVTAQVNRVAGLNVVGMKRAGFDPETRADIKKAFGLVYRSGLNLRDALSQAEQISWGNEGRRFFDFFQSEENRNFCLLLLNRRSNGSNS